MPNLHPAPCDDRRTFVANLFGDFQRQAARVCHRRTSARPGDASSVCSAALMRVLDTMYRAFDREREQSERFCRRAFAVALRDELVERTRKRLTLKNGGAYRQVPLDILADYLEAQHGPTGDLVDAIEDMRRSHPRRADIVTMRVYGNYSFVEIADEMGLDESTVRKQFKLAQAHLWRLFAPGDAL